MKKIAITIAATVALMTGGAFAQAETYTTDFTVYAVDQSHDLVTFIDANGDLWNMYGAYGWEKDDKANATMEDCNTQTIYDDMIVDIIKVRE